MAKRAFDSATMFWDETSMASGFATADSPVVSTNVINLGIADGDEDRLPRVQIVVEDGDSVSDDGTLQFEIQDSANGSSGWTTILTTRVSAGNATDFAGEGQEYALPRSHRPHVRLRALVATNNYTAGKLSAGVV